MSHATTSTPVLSLDYPYIVTLILQRASRHDPQPFAFVAEMYSFSTKEAAHAFTSLTANIPSIITSVSKTLVHDQPLDSQLREHWWMTSHCEIFEE